MTHSIRSRLLQAFFIVIFALSMTSVSFFLMHAYVVEKYKSNTDNMVNEYNLITDAANLISVYNSRVLSSASFSTAAEDKKIKDIKTDINNLTLILDKSITDKQSVAEYIGLKNTINAVIAEIDTGLTSIANNKPDASTHYAAANRKYTFVKDNGTALTFSELRHVASTQKQVNRSYKLSLETGVALFVLVGTGSILYVLKISKRIVNPLSKLTATAQQISGGDIEAVIDQNLLLQKDEAGSLSNSFNVMFQSLKEKIHEVSVEKASVEKKVEERTAELHDERIKLEASINSLNLGFLMVDLVGNVKLNPVAHRILNYAPDGKLARYDADERLTIDNVEAKLGPVIGLKTDIDQALDGLQSTERKAVDFNSHVLRIFIAPILQDTEGANAALGAVVLMEDITEMTIQERSKDEFFSIASHELRTPLTSIKGNSSMILDYYSEVLKDEQLREMVVDMHSSSIRLIEIVNDFLDVSRLEQGKMNFTYLPVSAEKVIESVAYEMKQVLTEKKLHLKIDRLTLDTLPLIWVDENRLKQVVYNLVGNAAKFTEEGTITISAELNKATKFIKVLVSDTGRGMTPESQQLLFHKFQQASSSLLTRDTTRGTGLGLYISKMIVESMGGVIKLEKSVEGEGTVFSFTVPVATEEQQASLPAAASVTDSTTGLTTADTTSESSPETVA